MNQAIGPSGHRAIMAVALQPDPWGFDEAPVETWADILRPQYLDLALLTAFIVLAMISFRRKSVPLKFVTFAFAIGRAAGWTAHCFEQRALGRLIRPQSVYVGRQPH